MTYTLHLDNLNWSYKVVANYVMKEGEIVSPRGMQTREVTGMTLIVHDTSNTMPECLPDRKINLAIGVAEALQLISGRSYPQLLAKIAGPFTRFMDGEILVGAYGPRIKSQVPVVVQRLKDDPHTRQAVLMIWDPMHDLFDQSRDVPCTTMMQFLIREDELDMHVKMRSNDVWLGLAYDIFQFSQLQHTIANVLGIPAGKIYHQPTSLHVYARDWEKAKSLHGHDPNKASRRWTGITAGTIVEAQDRANMLLRGETVDNMTPTENRYASILAPYMG